MLQKLKHRTSLVTLKDLVIQYTTVVSGSFLLSIYLHKNVIAYLDIYHTIMELACVFISLSIFLAVWFTYNNSSVSSHILGFGYLAIAAYDSFHAFYHLQLNLIPSEYFDMSTWFWILGRLTEATVLFLSVQSFRIRRNQWVCLLLTLGAVGGISILIHVYHGYLPVLLNEKGVTALKTALEGLVIFSYIFTLMKLRKRVTDRYVVTYKYLYTALLLAIPSEVCFAMYSSVESYIWMIGHILKIASYFYLFKGIFVSIVQELENVNLQTKTILDAVNNSVIMFNTDKRIVMYNKAFEEILELKETDLVGKTADYLEKMVRFEGYHLRDLLFQNNQHKKYQEFSVCTGSGNKKELLLGFTAINSIDGDTMGEIIVGTDITELKSEQAKIIQREKLALLGQLGAGIVHETRNFLTTIKGRCQLIDSQTKDSNVKKHTHMIHKNVDEVNNIISEFLFLSKPRECEMTEVAICDIIDSIKSVIESSSLIKGVDVQFVLSQEEKYLLCDESQLKQVILNMCKNAIDAMADVELANLRIETGYNEYDNEMFITISDNGKGIAKDQLKKIGTPFYTTKKSGTGLGLSVCYQIIKQHNGKIRVDSEVEKGTAFTIILPCIEADSMMEA